MEKNIKIVDTKKHNNKQVSDVINIFQQVKLGYLKFYVEKNYIYCENNISKERVVVGEVNKIEITVNQNIDPTKMFESLATIDAGSISKTRGVM